MLKRHAFSLSSARNHVFLQTNSLVSDMSTPEKRVLVGMSGGIDSTATCLMLKEQGEDAAFTCIRQELRDSQY